jgi:starvation-inducible outer membrane lipoprotein
VKTLTKTMLAAAVAISAGAAAATASADIVCNAADNVCWHVHRHYEYKPEFGVVVHPDNWAWGPNDHYVWKEHAGRGYWHNGGWVAF